VGEILKGRDRKVLEEQGYTTGKKTVQVKFGQKVPTIAIAQILSAQAAEDKAKD
jgi:hypothetical protein